MKKLLILGTLILLINGDSFSGEKKSESQDGIVSWSCNHQWPGKLDTITTNVFYPNGKRRLFY